MLYLGLKRKGLLADHSEGPLSIREEVDSARTVPESGRRISLREGSQSRPRNLELSQEEIFS